MRTQTAYLATLDALLQVTAIKIEKKLRDSGAFDRMGFPAFAACYSPIALRCGVFEKRFRRDLQGFCRGDPMWLPWAGTLSVPSVLSVAHKSAFICVNPVYFKLIIVAEFRPKTLVAPNKNWKF
jgi:hypothetical protein